jgi:hypothetical protein
MAQWYYARDGAQSGPVDDAALRQLASTGGLAPADLVWKEGMAEWVPASRIKALFPGGGGGGGATAPAAVATPAASAEFATRAASTGTLSYHSGGAGASVTPRTVDLLRQTKPWVRLFSVLMFIGFGFVILYCLLMLFATSFAGGTRGAGVGLVASLFMGAFGLLYFFPALFLWRYASGIGKLMTSGRADDLEESLQAQKSFWKFIGILTAIYLGFVALMVLLIVILGIAGAGGALR